jgi:protein-disulfide isomerase
LVVASAVWFIVVQLVIIRTICPYCMMAHATGGAAAFLMLLRRLRLDTRTSSSQIEPRPAASIKRGALPAALAMAALVVGQYLHAPKTYEKTSIDLPRVNAGNSNEVAALSLPVPTSNAPAVAQTNPATASQTVNSNSAEPALPKRRLHAIYNGMIQLDLFRLPMLGSPSAPHVIVSLFDYTCHHCREMHPRLTGALKSFGDQLGIVNLPMPLDPGCNYTMTRPNPMHTNACEYARIGLAVWKASPSAMQQFDDWIFEPERPPPLDEARGFAEQLVGKDAFTAAFRDPWVNQQLQMDVAIYDVAYRSGRGSMPQLLIGTNIYLGILAPEELGRAIREQFRGQ